LQYDDYNEDWANRDEGDNYKQEHDIVMTKEEVMPTLRQEYTTNVDEMIKMELENMRLLYGVKGKKKKTKKKKGKKGRKKKKHPKLPGLKVIIGLSKEERLTALI